VHQGLIGLVDVRKLDLAQPGARQQYSGIWPIWIMHAAASHDFVKSQGAIVEDLMQLDSIRIEDDARLQSGNNRIQSEQDKDEEDAKNEKCCRPAAISILNAEIPGSICPAHGRRQ